MEDQSIDMGKIFRGIINVQPEGAGQKNECPSENYTVQIEPSEIVDIATKEVKAGENAEFTINNNSNRTNEKITCTNNQSGKIEGNTITINKVTNNTTCTISYKVEPIIQVVSDTYNEKLWAYKDSVTKIIIEDSISAKSGETASWDISEANDKSVMGRIVPNTDGTTYTAYIQGEGGVKGNKNSSYLFKNFRYITTIEGLEKFDTSNVTNTSYMFDNAGENAKSFNIDLSNWDTSNVTDMSYMFDYAGENATSFSMDLSNWNTSNVTNMSYMFQEAGLSATSFSMNLSNWNTSNVTNMSYMFSSAGYNATSFSMDLSNWDTSKVIDMSYMFNYAGYNATTFNIGGLSNWNTSKVTDMSTMFSSAGYNATTFNIDLSTWNTSKVTNMSYMFDYAGGSATTFNSIGNFSIPNNCNVESFANNSLMFTGNIILEGNLSNYNTIFSNSTIKPGSRVNLIYNSTNEFLVDEIISLYGPSGTDSQGNIYKMSSASDIYTVANTVLNGTINGDTIKAVNSGDNVTFEVTPNRGLSNNNYTVTCTNGQTARLFSIGSTPYLEVTNITSSTVCTVEFELRN